MQRISAASPKAVVAPGMKTRSEHLAKFLEDEISKRAKVIRIAGVKAEQ